MCDGEQAGGGWLTGAQAVVETGRHENTIRRFIKKSFDIDGSHSAVWIDLKERLLVGWTPCPETAYLSGVGRTLGAHGVTVRGRTSQSSGHRCRGLSGDWGRRLAG